jgi:hypothetical protein
MDKGYIRVGIGFATGRKNFLKVLKTYIYNWKESGLTGIDRVRLHLFIAYDLNTTTPSLRTSRASARAWPRRWRVSAS